MLSAAKRNLLKSRKQLSNTLSIISCSFINPDRTKPLPVPRRRNQVIRWRRVLADTSFSASSKCSLLSCTCCSGRIPPNLCWTMIGFLFADIARLFNNNPTYLVNALHVDNSWELEHCPFLLKVLVNRSSRCSLISSLNTFDQTFECYSRFIEFSELLRLLDFMGIWWIPFRPYQRGCRGSYFKKRKRQRATSGLGVSAFKTQTRGSL